MADSLKGIKLRKLCRHILGADNPADLVGGIDGGKCLSVKFGAVQKHVHSAGHTGKNGIEGGAVLILHRIAPL